jgi:hypothetical protein
VLLWPGYNNRRFELVDVAAIRTTLRLQLIGGLAFRQRAPRPAGSIRPPLLPMPVRVGAWAS